MKNRIGIICAVIISCLVLASFSPSLDGRAVVADEGTFPQGLFAKTVGYLPGDSITVSNLSTKKTVDILVVGALDPSEGVAILLSPEAAFALGIEKNSNIIVKITKRSGQLDEAVSGTAVIANGTAASADSTDTVAAPADTSESEVPADTTAAAPAGTAGETSADSAPAETAAVQPEEKTETQPEPAPDESSAETITATETPAESEAAAPETEDVTASVPADEKVDEGLPASDETAAVPSAVPAASAEDTETDAARETESPADEKVDDTISSAAVPETAPVPETVTVDENAADETEAVTGEKIDEKIPPAEETAGPERTTDTTPPADESAAVPYAEEPGDRTPEAGSTDTAAERVGEQPVVTDKPDAESERVNAAAPAESAPSSAEDKVSSSDAYAPIILVPASPNPPETAAEPVPETPSAAPAVPAQKPERETAPASAPSGGEFDRYVVPNLKALKSGTYYIQIGVYADESNIREVVRKYSGTYPITIVPLVSGKANQMMIGPLSVDEYAAVLERFKSYGFKDAFLRKIK
ncbi:MAG TPA: hypothetical protein DCL73_01800 [Treponema sp.]|nr:hypothetical protein [Treponema sp.]